MGIKNNPAMKKNAGDADHFAGEVGDEKFFNNTPTGHALGDAWYLYQEEGLAPAPQESEKTCTRESFLRV